MKKISTFVSKLKVFLFIAIVALVTSMFTGCGKGNTPTPTPTPVKKVPVIKGLLSPSTYEDITISTDSKGNIDTVYKVRNAVDCESAQLFNFSGVTPGGFVMGDKCDNLVGTFTYDGTTLTITVAILGVNTVWFQGPAHFATDGDLVASNFTGSGRMTRYTLSTKL